MYDTNVFVNFRVVFQFREIKRRFARGRFNYLPLKCGLVLKRSEFCAFEHEKGSKWKGPRTLWSIVQWLTQLTRAFVAKSKRKWPWKYFGDCLKCEVEMKIRTSFRFSGFSRFFFFYIRTRIFRIGCVHFTVFIVKRNWWWFITVSKGGSITYGHKSLNNATKLKWQVLWCKKLNSTFYMWNCFVWNCLVVLYIYQIFTFDVVKMMTYNMKLLLNKGDSFKLTNFQNLF